MSRFLALILLLQVAVLCADPFQEIAAFSSLKPLNSAALARGETPITSNASMNLARGISSESCYFIPAPVEKVAALLMDWDTTKHAELETFAHHGFRNETEAKFESLQLDSSLSAVRHLLAAMRKSARLQINNEERALIPAEVSAVNAQAFWETLLRNRWRSFTASGLSRGAGYDTSLGAIDPHADLNAMLGEEPKIAEYFQALLAQTPLQRDDAGEPVFCYWDFSNVNKMATPSIGAIYRRGGQFADIEFYVASGYIAALSLYEIWPVQLGGSQGTLVWQANFASSTELTGAFGLKRKLAAIAIESDILRSIRLFRKDAAP